MEFLIPSARSDGYLFNGPFSILSATIFGSLAALLVPAFLAGNAVARDVQTHMEVLIYTTPISKNAYLGGRFLAAFVLFALMLLAIPAGHMIVTVLPGLESELTDCGLTGPAF